MTRITMNRGRNHKHTSRKSHEICTRYRSLDCLSLVIQLVGVALTQHSALENYSGLMVE